MTKAISRLRCVLLAAAAMITMPLMAGSAAAADVSGNVEDEKSVTVEIPVSCNRSGSDETFTYSLETDDPDHPENAQYIAVDKETLSLKDGGSGTFNIMIMYPGTYPFKVSQTKGSTSNMTYDDSVYNVTLYVTEDDNGKMSAEPVIYKKGSKTKVDKIEFINKLSTPGNSTPSPQTGDTMPPAAILVIIVGIAVALIGAARKLIRR